MKDLLLLHGALGSENQFDRIELLLSTQFKIHTLDFSGHGGLPIENVNYSIDTFCDDVLNYLKEARVEKVNIFGYSMGGYVAIALAAKYPSLVESIFTLATKFDWSPEQAVKETALLNPEKISQKVPAFAEELQQRHAPSDWKVVIQKTAEMMIGLGNNPLTDEDFKKVDCPVRISVGDRDKMVSIDSSFKVSQSFPKGSFLVMPDTQHPFELVDAERLMWEMENFF